MNRKKIFSNGQVFFALCFMSLFIVISGNAQNNEIPAIASDRPSISADVSLVPPHKFNIETGFCTERIIKDRIFQSTITYNTTLLRYGINNNAEIRLQTDYLGHKEDNINISGFNPLTIGTKLLINDTGEIIPKTSFLFNLTIPYCGSDYFRPSHFAPSFYLLLNNDLSQDINICYNLGMEFNGEDAEPDYLVTICLGYNITDNLNFMLESYSYFSDNLKPEYYFDTGFAYLLKKNLQIDISSGINAASLKQYFMFSCGLSWRLPD
jgi:hypothetical protein